MKLEQLFPLYEYWLVRKRSHKENWFMRSENISGNDVKQILVRKRLAPPSHSLLYFFKADVELYLFLSMLSFHHNKDSMN